MSVNIRDLLKEYDLEIDDLRWYLSIQMTERLLTYREEPLLLTELIWRGTLGDELYDMEERYLRESQEQMDRGVLDETRVREQLNQALRARRLRHR
ncbi:hypothetical protein B4O97_15505 [Marispirochaeta aestuarii]|uniref:Uncharacterized protein n=1 Tax=Marispirochaeta aestuarii TaxID=1963862 RepID=A0A1Y1RUU8_9SPIO|nr:hypothetical protein [Marispirochaeta aestuarii]ORC32858.1 hypothetical protein B4O97_15505 [Marispirochaeta aestuarii]